MYSDETPFNRIWMPCVEREEVKCLWDFEFVINTMAFAIGDLEKLHAVSSGVLFRQVNYSAIYD